MIEHLNYFASTLGPGGLQTAWEFLQKGGVFMIPLVLTSIAGLMAIFYKILSLSKARVIPRSLAQEVDQFQGHVVNDGTAKVIQEFQKGESALARLCAVVIKHKGKSRSEITYAVESAAREEVLHLHAGISVLDTIITIAPLLGLLGTASGLVRIFQGLGDQADHLAIAHGIAEALTTTIFGLAIAVPCVVAHGYFTRRIEMLTAKMESLLSVLTHACEKPSSLS